MILLALQQLDPEAEKIILVRRQYNMFHKEINKMGTQMAYCPMDRTLHIAEYIAGKWETKYIYNDHERLITSIDWHPETNKIVICSEDRNAYVYEFHENNWVHKLVILRFKFSATCVKWSPSGDKFAVGSSGKVIAICHYDTTNNWWVSTHIKGHRSGITSVNWHPNNELIVSSSNDGATKIFSTISMQEIGSYESNCIINYSTWSLNGDWLIIIPHNSTIKCISQTEEQKIICRELPYTYCAFIDNTKFITVGHDKFINIYHYFDGTWSLQEQRTLKHKRTDTSMYTNIRNTFEHGQVINSDTEIDNINSVTIFENGIIYTSIDGFLYVT